MPNKSSPHGGFICEGTISHGTLRTQDLLRTFSDEYRRVLPFNYNHQLAADAFTIAQAIDDEPEHSGHTNTGQEIVNELIDELDVIAEREGMTFSAHEGDGSDFGYWTTMETAD